MASQHLPGQSSWFTPQASVPGLRAPTEPQPRDNSLLACLTEAHSHEVLQALQLVTLPRGLELTRDLYFPTSGIVSFVHEFANGRSAEFAMTGSEGVVGLDRFFSGENSPYHAVVISAGYAYRLAGKDRQYEQWQGCEELRSALLRYAHAFITQVALTAVSNRHGLIDKQLCRWLLLCMDRVQCDELRITQELIANMLGVRRESVTQALGRLQSCGMVRCFRGRITVFDRAGLEAIAGECYQNARHGNAQLLSAPRIGAPRCDAGRPAGIAPRQMLPARATLAARGARLGAGFQVRSGGGVISSGMQPAQFSHALRAQ